MQAMSLLQKLGFSAKEALIYVKILENPGLSYAQLSSLTKVNRTTCYSVVKSLISRELISEDLGSAVVKISPKSTQGLLEKLEKDKLELTKKTELTRRTMLELESLIPGRRISEPRLTYIEEPQILEFLYKRAEKWLESIKQYDSIVWGFESANFELDYTEWIAWYWSRPASGGAKLQLFSDEPNIRKDASSTGPGVADFQFIPDLNFTTNIWIYGNYIVLLSLEEKPHYLIELKEPLLAKNLREFFKSLWKATELTWEKTSKNRKVN